MNWSEEKYNEFVNMMEQKYPKMFSYPYGGFAIGEGWWDIIRVLCAQIDAYTKWKRNNRAYALLYNRARTRGYDAMLKFVMKGKDPEFATEWQIDQVERNMNEPRNVPVRVEHIRVLQIKEKFGGLRFYYDGGDEYISGLVDMAETWAGHTCEQCGDRGERRSGGWVQTLCDKHEAERQEKNESLK